MAVEQTLRLRHGRGDGEGEGEETVAEVSAGDGPIDGIFLAIEQATGVTTRCRDFRVQGATSGEWWWVWCGRWGGRSGLSGWFVWRALCLVRQLGMSNCRVRHVLWRAWCCSWHWFTLLVSLASRGRARARVRVFFFSPGWLVRFAGCALYVVHAGGMHMRGLRFGRGFCFFVFRRFFWFWVVATTPAYTCTFADKSEEYREHPPCTAARPLAECVWGSYWPLSMFSSLPAETAGRDGVGKAGIELALATS